MSLFDKLNNKRYDLQEIKKKTSPSASSGNNNSNKNISTSRKNIKKAIADLEATQPGGETPKIETGRTTYNKNKKLDQDLNQRRTAQDRQQQLYNRQYDAYDDGDLGNPNQTKAQTSTKTKPIVKTTTNTVKQSKVSDDASEFTKRVNRGNKNRKEFIKGRKTYTDSKTGIEPGKPTKEGIKKYITKARNMSQGTNANNAKNQAAAEVISKSSGKEYSDKITKKYETNKRMIKSRKPRKTISQLKKEIDLKDIQKASNYKAGAIKRSKELKDLTKKMGEKELKQRVASAAALKNVRPQRQAYKTGLKLATGITKTFGGAKVAPVVKAATKVVAAAPAPVKIAGAAGLALLNPSIRRGAKRVAKAALGAAGIKAFTSKPKVASRPPTSIGINLSSGKGKSTSSKYAVERIKQLAKNPSKVANKNLA